MSKENVIILDSTKGFEVTKAEDGDEFYIEGYASKSTVDRDHEIIPVEAIDTVNFMKNPIILDSHDRYTPVGKAILIEKRVDGLWIKVLISKTADKLRTLISEGILKAFSVGFRIKDYDYQDNGLLIYKDIELTEVSLVAIPCNQDALFSQVKSFNDTLIKDKLKKSEPKKEIDMTDLEKMKAEMEEMKAEKARLEAEKAARIAKEKEEKDLAEKAEMKKGIDTLTETLKALQESLDAVKAEATEKETKLKEELEAIKTAAPKIVEPAVKEVSEFTDKFKDAVVESMLFNRELQDTKMFNSLPERIKAVSLDAQFTTQVRNQMLEDIKEFAPISQLFVQIPSEITSDVFPFSADIPSNWGTSATDQAWAPTKVQIDYKSIFSSTTYDYVSDNESIIQWLPFLRGKLNEAIGEGIDTAIVNSTTVTNAYASLPVMAFAAATINNIGVADEADITVADIDTVRAAMGKYGVKSNDLALILNSAKYLQLVDDDSVTPVDKFGPKATILSGQLGSVRGIPIFVNDSAPGSSAVGITNVAFTIVNTKMFGFKLKSQMMEFDKVITSQTQVIVSSARAGFGALKPLSSSNINGTFAMVGVNPAA